MGQEQQSLGWQHLQQDQELPGFGVGKQDAFVKSTAAAQQGGR
jgi:hypothetical protein